MTTGAKVAQACYFERVQDQSFKLRIRSESLWIVAAEILTQGCESGGLDVEAEERAIAARIFYLHLSSSRESELKLLPLFPEMRDEEFTRGFTIFLLYFLNVTTLKMFIVH
uniref:Uncharacterized protein n=1 Tax=Kalanchoe fedtschenkoi TaxID=63787 RepID=A0A7N0VLI3_KALFE